MSSPKAVICPYCGQSQTPADRCRACLGLFEPLSRQATHNAMGPWFVRDPARPFHPGCSYETLVKMIERGMVTKLSIVRGPTTRQFWTVAKRTPGVSHLLGYCHGCDANVSPSDHGCGRCGVPFGAYLDRDYLGLPEIKAMPWEAQVERPIEKSVRLTAPATASATNGGLSRFASNDELLGHAPSAALTEHEPSSVVPAHPHPIPGVKPIGVGVSSYDIPATAAALTPVEFASSPLARSMQRRMEAQRRLIVGLFIVMGVLAVILLLSNLPRLAGTSTTSVEKPSTASKPAATPEITPPAPLPTGAAETAVVSSPATTSSPVRSTEPEASAGPYASEFARAQLLLSKAEDIDRPLADRIKDCEEAILVLENIQANAPTDQLPDGLNQTLADARKELERLKLKTIMP